MHKIAQSIEKTAPSDPRSGCNKDFERITVLKKLDIPVYSALILDTKRLRRDETLPAH